MSSMEVMMEELAKVGRQVRMPGPRQQGEVSFVPLIRVKGDTPDPAPVFCPASAISSPVSASVSTLVSVSALTLGLSTTAAPTQVIVRTVTTATITLTISSSKDLKTTRDLCS